ncbi:MAG: cell division protein ZipA C-terminal FtsZ-binding domain-containing protein [Rhodocyclaceae bacterium]|nr:cell division protein ZipA C-terminal FtsZ-binding domain-containing protein [Rhodocyclaceae bacterium]
MNEFQLSLFLFCVVAVTMVWVYNLWQEHVHQKWVQKVFPDKRPDVLMASDQKVEPEIQEIGESSQFPESQHRDRPPISSPPASSSALSSASSSNPSPVLSTDPLRPPLPTECADDIVDCTLAIEFAKAAPASALWSEQIKWAVRLAKPVAWLGLDESAFQRQPQWHQLNAHDTHRYSKVRVSLQLADRRGPVTDSDLSVFFEGVRQVTRKFSGLVEIPSSDGILLHARSLDEFCAGVDIQLEIGVVPKGQQGSMIPFLLDVTQQSDGLESFDRILDDARRLIREQGGQLVDMQKHPLTEEMIATIRTRISEVQKKMASHQIPAGSIRALRLFS